MAVYKGEKVDLIKNVKTNPQVIQIEPIELSSQLSWKKVNLIFRGESLADVMDEITRYTNIDFELENDDNIKQVKVVGLFKTGDVSGLLAALKKNFNIEHQKISNNKIRLFYVN